MTYDNEELIIELQKVGRELNRVRHGRRMGCLPHGEHEGTPEGFLGWPESLPGEQADAPHGERHGGPVFDGPRGGIHGGPHGHGVGNHKNHGGSGRHGQNRILAALSLSDGMSQKDLAYLLGIRPQSLTQALETLEADGFIERRTDEADKRARKVFLTEGGRTRAAKVAADRKQWADDALSVLTDEEREQLGIILEKISAGLAPKPHMPAQDAE